MEKEKLNRVSELPLDVENKVEQESGQEKKAEKIKDSPSTETKEGKVPVAPNLNTGVSVPVRESSYEEKKIEAIESIMAEGLDQVFLKMTASQQKKFKSEGEKTAKKISHLLTKAKSGAEKIVKLIRNWLKLVPKINRFFLEQEAKIKADKILKIKKNL